ncbi:MAG: RnfABCDGE type electron transport complex subunit B, partial [Deltaproteobacteria bacterium]|nr:RnfABCDGE type electron transport complex subunit B [Deltaproteobacteria bacterium]
MYEAIFMMGGLGLIIGIGLAIASKIFYVYVDPKILAVDDLLPGANCGGCGLPGCAANAEAIVAGQAAPNSCVAGGSELAEAIASLLGLTVAATEPDIALSGCYYGVSDADLKYDYDGVYDCRAAAMLSGGMKVCTIGCLGLGTCVKACPFNAITMGPEGLPVVHEGRCTGCGTCERVCPKHIINLSSITRRIIREYTTEECTTPCQRACPAGINIREYIRQIALGNSERAVQIIKERNPFPAVIGRICPRPCEQDCRRKYLDEPVAINFLKRYASDCEREIGNRVLPYKAPDTGSRVAGVGGGVSGLSTAFFIARLGHQTTVYEATEQLGGLLYSAIAANRLPKESLAWDIQGILEMGVTAETEKMLGRDITIESLLQDGFDAVSFATGGWDNRLTRGVADPEIPVAGLSLLIDWLKTENKNPIPLDNQSEVVIVGQSKLAMVTARTCMDRGAKKVTVIFRDPPERLPVADEDGLLNGNVDILTETAVNRILGQENCITEIEAMDLNTSDMRSIFTNCLILESGRFPELIFTPKSLENEQ